ncbi:hypothetical protein ACJWDR_01880 [Streptomyces tauricus]|uniref:hypothetical protein n=1 Tax=Streptomyces tauricus TaxID=68274 RepID=UPI00387F31DC
MKSTPYRLEPAAGGFSTGRHQDGHPDRVQDRFEVRTATGPARAQQHRVEGLEPLPAHLLATPLLARQLLRGDD